jgi:hypothetical protein
MVRIENEKLIIEPNDTDLETQICVVEEWKKAIYSVLLNADITTDAIGWLGDLLVNISFEPEELAKLITNKK